MYCITKLVSTSRNLDGNNPVHLAAINGYTNTIVAILSIHSHLVDAENRQGVSCIWLYVLTVLNQSPVLSIGGPRGVRAPLTVQNVSLFYTLIFWKVTMSDLGAPYEVGIPLWEILDPPLLSDLNLQINLEVCYNFENVTSWHWKLFTQ